MTKRFLQFFFRPACMGALMVAAMSSGLRAQIPRMLDYQGRIAVHGVNFDGTGQFKFALVNPSGTVVYWNHDGTAVSANAPASAVSLPVVKGIYSTRLGDVSTAGMSALPPGALNHPDVRLRVWFNDGTSGFQALVPDRRISAVAYAVMAESVPDSSITSEKLAPGSVTLDKLAPGVNVGGGGTIPANVLLASYSAHDPALTTLGYLAVQTFPAKPWVSGPAGSPSARSRHSAVWTGAALLVWGGETGGALSNQGGSYSPAAEVWAQLPVNSLNPARADHTAVWTGDRMVIWGGATASGTSATGAVFHPDSQTWVNTAAENAPDARSGHSAVWTGSRMIVWGGRNGGGAMNSGASYAPPVGPFQSANGNWQTLSSSGAPSPRRDHSAVWTGNRMLIWGGLNNTSAPLADGASYDPASDHWAPLSSNGAPAWRTGHSAVWTGSRMIIFGGSASGVVYEGGGIYDPATDTWAALPAASGLDARAFHRAVWTGSEMLVFGGTSGGSAISTRVAGFKPATALWRSLSPLPSAISQPAGVWSGQSLLLFGGTGLTTLDITPPLVLYGKF